MLAHLVQSIAPEARCSRIPKCKKKMRWSAIMHEPYMNSSVQIHIFKQFWEKVSCEIVVKSPRQMWQKTETQSLHGNSRWTLIIFFNPQDAGTRKPCLRRPVFYNIFFLHCGLDSPSVGLALHFSFALSMLACKACGRTLDWMFLRYSLQIYVEWLWK